MDGDLNVDVVPTSALGPAEQAAWDGFRAASPELGSPFFAFDYNRIAGEHAPHAAVAVLHRGGRIAGFLPFQRRRGALQPLAAPLTDFHGLIAAPGEAIDLGRLVRRLGASAFRFSGLTAPVAPAGANGRNVLAADLRGGFDAYYAERRAVFAKYYKDKERAARSMERDHGAPEWRADDREPGLLDWIIERKREQYRRTGQYDVFACGWTADLLRRLRAERGPGIAGRIATLRLGGELAAAEYSLVSGSRMHFWFPAYAPDFARCSPGALLSLNTMRTVAAEGVTQADFGLDAEGYKKYYATPAGVAYEGVLPLRPLRRAASSARDRALAPARLAYFRRKIERRLNVVTACEPGWSGLAAEMTATLGRAALRRHTVWVLSAASGASEFSALS